MRFLTTRPWRGIAVALGASVLIPTAMDTRPICKRASKWVQAHRSTLPTSLEALNGFPVAYRRQIFNALPASVKSDLWTRQMTDFLRNDLTGPQRVFVSHAIHEVLTPSAYGSRGTRLSDQELQDLLAQAKTLFVATRQIRALTTLGGDEPRLGDFRTFPVVFREAFATFFTLSATCGCSTHSDWCANGYECSSFCTDGFCCETTPWGCGTFGLFPCDGVCR